MAGIKIMSGVKLYPPKGFRLRKTGGGNSIQAAKFAACGAQTKGIRSRAERNAKMAACLR